MSSQQRFHLGQLTALSLPPRELIPMAADAGYDAVGIRLLPSTPGGQQYFLPPGSSELRDVKNLIASTGTTIYEVECLLIDADFDVEKFRQIFETAGSLGARSMLTTCNDSDHTRLTDLFARLCEALAPYGMTADLEFVPTKGVETARDALKIVRAAGQKNGGILIDAIHVARTDSPLSDILEIPHSMINYWQICDAPAERPDTTQKILFAGRNERLLPGEGGLDLAKLARLMPYTAAISVEIPTITRAFLGPEKWIKLALERSRVFMKSDCGVPLIASS